MFGNLFGKIRDGIDGFVNVVSDGLESVRLQTTSLLPNVVVEAAEKVSEVVKDGVTEAYDLYKHMSPPEKAAVAVGCGVVALAVPHLSVPAATSTVAASLAAHAATTFAGSAAVDVVLAQRSSNVDSLGQEKMR